MLRKTRSLFAIVCGAFFTISCLALALITWAQPPVQWEETYGGPNYDAGYGLHLTADGFIYGKGQTNSFGAGDLDYYLIKVNADGGLLWQETYGGAQTETIAMQTYQTSDSVFILGGNSNSFSGSYDYYLVKTDVVGTVLWSHTYGTGNEEVCDGVTETSEGGYVMSGSTETISNGRDLYIVKTDASGNQEWTTTSGYSSSEHAYGIRQTSDGGFITAGYTRSFNPADDGLLVKLDSTGTVQWSQHYLGHSWDYFFIVLETEDGGFIAAGYSDIYSGGPAQVWVVKTDALGNQIWNRYYGGSAEDRTYSLALSPLGGYYIGAETQATPSGLYDAWLMEVDAAGNVMWEATYGDDYNQAIISLIATEEGGFILGGYDDGPSPGGGDFYLLRLQDAGTPQIETTLIPSAPPIQIPAGGGSFQYNFEMTQTGTGWCEVDVLIDVTFPEGEVLPILQREGIILQAGQTIQRDNLLQTVPASAPEGNYTYAVHIWDVSGWILYAEDSFTFEKLPGFGIGDQSQAWILTGWEEACPVGVKSVQHDQASLCAYPNPFNVATAIGYELNAGSTMKLTVYDTAGRVVTTLVDSWQEAGVHEATFDGSNLASGIYLARLEAGDFTTVQKLVLMK